MVLQSSTAPSYQLQLLLRDISPNEDYLTLLLT